MAKEFKTPVALVHPGDDLLADGCFTCIEAGTAVRVHRDERGELYVGCASGQHGLDGQLSEDGDDYVGFLNLTRDTGW